MHMMGLGTHECKPYGSVQVEQHMDEGIGRGKCISPLMNLFIVIFSSLSVVVFLSLLSMEIKWAVGMIIYL